MQTLVRAALVAALCTTSACGSQYTILDRSTVEVSANARLSAQNLVADAEKFPTVIQQLALAQEVYQRQLYLLKERRNKLRSRERTLTALSFGTFAASAVGMGAAAIATDETDAANRLRLAGGLSLGALAIGTAFQVGAYMQEDVSSVDSKVRLLELRYDTMLERLRQLTYQATLGQPAEAASGPSPTQAKLVAEMGAAIEAFITEALAINVKG